MPMMTTKEIKGLEKLGWRFYRHVGVSGPWGPILPGSGWLKFTSPFWLHWFKKPIAKWGDETWVDDLHAIRTRVLEKGTYAEHTF